MGKKRVGRYPKEFRRVAVERLKNCDNITARLLQDFYKVRDMLLPPSRRTPLVIRLYVRCDIGFSMTEIR